jgi:hypothetical protein
MNAVIIGIFIVIAIVSRLREAMKDKPGDRLRDGVRPTGRLLPDSEPDQAPGALSLQQVLAEIQKVKTQSERAPETMQAGSVRDQIRRAALTQERKQELAERAERKRREAAAARNAESVHPVGRLSAAGPQPAPVAPVADQPPSETAPAEAPASQLATVTQGSTPLLLRPNPAQMRDAFVWREILSVPVSLREEPTEQS